ncbi:MAG: phage tail protein [Chlorobiaceae bacterium]|nr:phage tail protein [Chlorobiaceae bacterium]
MAYKTPGVYIKEVALFPPSVAQVETAVPAFVGYTEKAADPNGKSLAGVPARIKSLVEFQSLFGGEYVPTSYKVVVESAAANSLVSVAPDKRFYLFDALRQFYDNGGGNCYIVSVGSYDEAIDFDSLKGGLDRLKKVDEPTLLLSPDAVGLRDSLDKPDLAGFTDLQKELLTQCATLQDRFAILDILEGQLAEDVSNKPISNFRDTIGINNLSYGAAYYPWIVTSYSYDISFRQLHFYDKSDLLTEILNYIPYARNDAEKGLVSALAVNLADTNATINITDSSLNKTRLLREGISHLKGLLSGYQAKIAANTALVTNMTAYLNLLAGIVLSFKNAESQSLAGSGYRKEIDSIKSDAALVAAIVALVAVEKNPKTVANTVSTRTDTVVAALYKPLETDWLGGKTVATVLADATAFTANSAGCLSIINKLAGSVTTILDAYQRLLDAALHFEVEAEEAVFAGHLFFGGVRDKIVEYLRTIPPSGSVAGIYSAVDYSRGVWKAPANVSINSIVGPAVKIDSRDQEDLNVHTTGKSVNAIRAFTGKGTLVWGARTLAGNDNEWRYVPVRRFFIMVEESTKKASEPFVFESNDANTWVKVRAMIENFLILQWRAGALQGAKPNEAFYVRVGLNETMTAQDILEGYMIIEIGMAVVRPAEFIILRFSHKMLSGG